MTNNDWLVLCNIEIGEEAAVGVEDATKVEVERGVKLGVEIGVGVGMGFVGEVV